MFDDDAVVDVQNEPCAQYRPGNSEKAALPEAAIESESITSEEQPVTDDQDSEIARNDAVCNAVTDVRANAIAAPELAALVEQHGLIHAFLEPEKMRL